MTKPGLVARALLFLVIILSLAEAQVVNTDKGKVEFIGLKRWSVRMIEESLAVYAPKGHGLWGCAAELVGNLHFADASVIRYSEYSAFYTVITVIEPQDSTRIQYRPKPSGSSAVLPDYKIADSIIRKDMMAFQMALINYGLFKSGKLDSAETVIREWGVDSLSVTEIWRFLYSKKDEKHKPIAIWTALNNPDATNRTIAASILSNFAEDDSCWWTLIEVLRDRDGIVNSTARQALTVMTKPSIKIVNWTPCVPTLKFLLAGTDLFSYTTVLNVLHKTGISPTLADALLDESTTDLLLAYLQAKHSEERKSAIAFLVNLSGQDFGDDWRSWQNWLRKR